MLAEKQKVEAEQLEPLIANSDEEEEPYKDEPVSFAIQLLTMIVGIGSAWLLLDGLWVQLPYFQRYSPEGMLLANQMTICGAIAGIPIVPVYICIDRGWNIHYRAFIYILMAIQAAACLMVAFFWNVTVDDLSVIILLGTFIAQFCACIQGVVVVAYFTSINNRLTAPLWVGANTGIQQSVCP